MSRAVTAANVVASVDVTPHNISLALATGPFELPNIAPGSYEVLARVADANAGTGLGAFSWGRAIVDVDDRDVSGVSIAINPPAVLKGTVRMTGGGPLPANLRVSFEILVSSGGGIVSGIVEDGPTKIAAGAVVALVPEAKRFENRTLFASTTSDASGRFVFRGVAPGDYRLFAWESTPPNAYQNAGFIRKYESRAQLVHIGQGGSVTAQLTIIPALETR